MFEITVTYFDGSTYREDLNTNSVPEFFSNLEMGNVEKVELVSF